MRKIEDMADSPLVPALLEKVHLDADEALMKASRAFSHSNLTLDENSTLTVHDSTSARTSTSTGCCRTSASSRRARSTAG